jgi:hypothetical protein
VTRDPIVHPGDQVSADKPTAESVCKPNQATQEGHSVPDEKMTEKRKMRADDIPSFKYKPIGSNKDSESSDQPRDNALQRCV